MSHWTVYKTAVGNLSNELLVKAFQFIIPQIPGAVFITQTRAYDRTVQHFSAGIKIAGELPNGIGFSVDGSGHLLIHGDPYNQTEAFARLKTMAESGQITNAYKIALNAIQQKHVVQVRVQQKQILLEVV